MSTKQKYITLTPCYTDEDRKRLDGKRTGYKVHQVKNSLEFQPGQVITKPQAEELCGATNWTVTVQEDK